MTDQYTFNTFSFFSGMLTGLIIRWTDIIPILGGFVLGISVKKLPEFINYNDLPAFAKKWFDYVGKITSASADIEVPTVFDRKKKSG